MKYSQRSNQLEIIDRGYPYYTPEEYQDCLYQLDRIGRFLGGDRATYKCLNRLKKAPESILDVGCGGGLFTIKLAQRYAKTQVLGIDISKEAIEFANLQLNSLKLTLPNLQFSVPSTPELNYPPKSFDLITSTLVCHHLKDEELISFLKRADSIARQAIILNDLHRHPLATFGFNLLTPLLFPNRLVKHDGPLSIKRSFKKHEWKNYLQAAGISSNRYTISWHWAFRWTIVIYPSSL